MPRETRFSLLVRKSGRPETAALWSQPEKNVPFMRAVKENRVLTVVQRHKGAKDFGLIGFHEQPQASYFVFPKQLPTTLDGRVVGIKYDLIQERGLSDAPTAGVEKKNKQTPGAQGQYRIVIGRKASVELALNVKASNKKEALTEALKEAESSRFDPEQANIRSTIKSIPKR